MRYCINNKYVHTRLTTIKIIIQVAAVDEKRMRDTHCTMASGRQCVNNKTRARPSRTYSSIRECVVPAYKGARVGMHDNFIKIVIIFFQEDKIKFYALFFYRTRRCRSGERKPVVRGLSFDVTMIWIHGALEELNTSPSPQKNILFKKISYIIYYIFLNQI